MNANQVVIVMDRDEAKSAENGIMALAGKANGLPVPDEWWSARDKIRAALDRDPDELEARLAEAINEGTCRYWGAEHKPLDALSDRDREAAIARSRAVLAVLGEEGGPE